VTRRKLAVRSPEAATNPPLRRGSALAYARDDAAGSARDAVRPRSVLIVEDDFLVALAAEAALREAGFEVAGVVVSAEAAIAEAAAKQPSLVVMDVRLAGRRDGIDAAIQLFRDHGIPCIFATAHYDAEAHARASRRSRSGGCKSPIRCRISWRWCGK
jgi:two-component system, response regulator PdtaR